MSALRNCGWLMMVIMALQVSVQSVEAACGYKSCPATKSNMINVHLVPHSHDDVGWLKTVDQYYYGSRNNIQHAGVQYILDNIVQELLKDKTRRFIYVESAFFFKWYEEQSAAAKKSVKQLIDDGRLEIVGGAWSMNDEAAVHYQSVIDQFSLGLKALSDTFGACARPRIGWQIDPFGHSREMASLFAQMGYDGEFFARIDWMDKQERLSNLTAEMIWKASGSLGERSELFTGLLYNHYSAPPGFCFDILCADAPIIDGISTDNNVQQKVNDFLAYIQKMSLNYRGTHLMVPMGDDFQYENAAMNFKNMDKLIKYVNARQSQGSKINVFYSTPSCYLNSLHEDRTLTYPTKTQDFFPYSTSQNAYWTGYYSSRPTQKYFERLGNNLLQVTKQLTVMAGLNSANDFYNLGALSKAMGIMQHHDAITGTEKQHVAQDYDRLLSDALSKAQLPSRDALRKLTNLTSGEFGSCLQQNISMCEFTRTGAKNIVVTLVNPLSRPLYQYVRIPVKNESHVVRNEKGAIVSSVLLPVPQEVLALPYRDNSTHFELVFDAYVNKIASFYIDVNPKPRARISPRFHYRVNSNSNDEQVESIQQLPAATPAAVGDTIVQMNDRQLIFNSNNQLTGIKMNGLSESITQQFFYYRGAGNATENSSGAYIFRPNGTEVPIVANSNAKLQMSVHKTDLVVEVHQRFNEYVSQVIRMYHLNNYIEFEWLVGPIPINDAVGKEIITRFSSSIQNNGVFWTDSNGREMLKRTLNQREYFKPNMTQAVAGNYYPVTARIVIEDQRKRLALINDRSQGGSSLKNGALELMLHRRLLRDDGFGVGEALNETAFGQGVIARGKFQLVLSPLPSSVHQLDERNLQQQMHLPFWQFYSNSSRATTAKPLAHVDFSYLPQPINVLSLEPYSSKEVLLRLEHYLDRSEYGFNVSFNMQDLFNRLAGEEIRETTLDGNMALSEMKRFRFTEIGKPLPSKVEYYTTKHKPLAAKKSSKREDFDVTFEPMQIRTFIIKKK